MARTCNIIFIFLALLVFISAEPCKPNNPSDKTSLPPFPDQFETRILMTNARNETSDVLLIYDNFNKKAELVTEENGLSVKRLYYFSTNEFFQIVGDIGSRPDTCIVRKINEVDDLFFGLISSVGSLNQPNDVFHFNPDQFPIEKLTSTESIRGIAVDRFQSCQTFKGAQFLIDFYFNSKEFSMPVTYDSFYKQVLLQMTIQGSVIEYGSNFNNIYSFYEFKSHIENRADLFTLPEGVSCVGHFNIPNLPQIPEEFTFYEQQGSFFQKVFYSSALKAVRFDLAENKQGHFKAFNKILDLNSGVLYSISKEDSTCFFNPIDLTNSQNLYTKYAATEYGLMLELTPPSEIFFRGDSFYAGQRLERGVLCDVFVANKKSVKDQTSKSEFYEAYFRVNTSGNSIPLSIHVNNIGSNRIEHFYNFNSRFDAALTGEFSLSQCFQGKEKIFYGIRFTYPADLFSMQSREEFETNHQLIGLFNQVVYKALYGQKISPLRLISPRDLGDQTGFTVLTGITESAPAINHFKKADKQEQLSHSTAKYTQVVSSAEKCATSCLLSQYIENIPDDFKCMSFDYCYIGANEPSVCIFNDKSVSVNDSLIDETSTPCDHYSKITNRFDTLGIEAAFGLIEKVALRNLNEPIVFRTNKNKDIVFPDINIFRTNEFEGFNSGVNQQATSFSKQFYQSGKFDFNETTMELASQNVLRQRVGISFDECTRFCVEEQNFECFTISYSSILKHCKWTSLNAYGKELDKVFYQDFGVDLFMRDLVSTYIKYEYQVTIGTDYKVIDAASPNDCAFKCNSESSFLCRSFSLCEYGGAKYKCLLSQTNVHQNSNLTGAVACSHYSKNGLSDFKVSKKYKIGLEAASMIFNVTAERCAEICILEDSYLCRSFNYYLDTGNCGLYKENLVDERSVDLKLEMTEFVDLYSRLYYVKDGVTYKVEPLSGNGKNVKYGFGIILGVVVALLVGGFVLGVMGGMTFLKMANGKKGEPVLPSMKFVNPNYSKQVNDEIDFVGMDEIIN